MEPGRVWAGLAGGQAGRQAEGSACRNQQASSAAGLYKPSLHMFRAHFQGLSTLIQHRYATSQLLCRSTKLATPACHLYLGLSTEPQTLRVSLHVSNQETLDIGGVGLLLTQCPLPEPGLMHFCTNTWHMLGEGRDVSLEGKWLNGLVFIVHGRHRMPAHSQCCCCAHPPQVKGTLSKELMSFPQARGKSWTKVKSLNPLVPPSGFWSPSQSSARSEH